MGCVDSSRFPPLLLFHLLLKLITVRHKLCLTQSLQLSSIRKKLFSISWEVTSRAAKCPPNSHSQDTPLHCKNTCEKHLILCSNIYCTWICYLTYIKAREALMLIYLALTLVISICIKAHKRTHILLLYEIDLLLVWLSDFRNFLGTFGDFLGEIPD